MERAGGGSGLRRASPLTTTGFPSSPQAKQDRTSAGATLPNKNRPAATNDSPFLIHSLRPKQQQNDFKGKTKLVEPPAVSFSTPIINSQSSVDGINEAESNLQSRVEQWDIKWNPANVMGMIEALVDRLDQVTLASQGQTKELERWRKEVPLA